MNKAELIFFYLATGFYSLAFIMKLFHGFDKSNLYNVFKRDWLLIFGFVFHLFTIILRWEFSGHLPVMGTYESALSGSLVTAFLIILFKRKYPEILIVHQIGLLLIITLMFYGFLFPAEYIPLTISEQSVWIDVHAFFAWVALGNYVIAFGCAAGVIFPGTDMNDRINHKQGLMNQPPANIGTLHTSFRRGGVTRPIQDEIMFYSLCVGFFFQTLMMATGIYYNFILFGHWWRWDPIETVALISWLVSGLVIHAKLFYGWKERRFAILVIVSFLFIIILYKVFPFLPRAVTFHNFDLTF
ncbi:MAG TPA: cytochrome c biogenesis protein CcsA [bacterium]